MLTKLALILFTLVVAPTALGASQAEHFRAIAQFFNIEASEALASAQQANLNSNFSANFATLDDLNVEKVTQFGRNYPDRIVAFRDYLQLLTQKGYIEASQALTLLEFAMQSATETNAPIIGKSRNKIVTASTPYDAKLPPPTTANANAALQKQISESVAPNINVLPNSNSGSAVNRDFLADLSVSAESNRVYSNGRDVGTFGGVTALAELTKKAKPFYVDGGIALHSGKVYTNYNYSEAKTRYIEASLGAGLYSGGYTPTEFTGLQSSVKISSEWFSGSIDGSSISDRESYVSLGVIGGNGNTAVDYEVETPTSNFIDSGAHTIKLYFPYEKRDNSTSYFSIGIQYQVSPGLEALGLVIQTGAISRSK